MKIGIFETEHFEGAYPVIRLFDNDENRLTIFSFPDAFRQFQFLFGDEMKRYDWVVKSPQTSKISFIRAIYRETKKRKLDLLYLNTVTDNFLFYACLVIALPHVRIVVTIHDVNNYFELHPPYTFRKLLRFVGKYWLMNVVKEFNVVALTLVDGLQARLPVVKQVHCLPGAVFDPAKVIIKHVLSSPINITVPGTVDSRRRKYADVFELLNSCEHLGIAIDITLLGGISTDYGQDILQQCLGYSGEIARLHFYQGTVVDQPEFDRVMNECDLVWIPSIINTVIADDTPEIYGISISSGNLFDVIKHAKPFLAPAALRVDPFLETSCNRYKNTADIIELLKLLREDANLYGKLSAAALSASAHYTVEAVRRRNPSLFPGN